MIMLHADIQDQRHAALFNRWIMTRVYLIRHGTTNDNKSGIFQGSRDVPLGEQGLKQAAFLAERLRNVPISAIYSSPLLRAKVTADMIAEYHQVKVCLDSRLKEQNCGILEGNTGSYNYDIYPDIIENMKHRPAAFDPPGGEKSIEVYYRITECIDEIALNHPGKEIAIITHGFAIQYYLSYAQGLAFSNMPPIIVPNASISTIDYAAGGIRITGLGDDNHLPEEMRFTVSHKNF